MILLPKELRQAVHAAGGRPVRLADPETSAEYVVLQADVNDQVQSLLNDDAPLTSDAITPRDYRDDVVVSAITANTRASFPSASSPKSTAHPLRTW